MKIDNFALWGAVSGALACHLIFNLRGTGTYVLTAVVSGILYSAVRLITKKKLGAGDVYFGIFQGMCLPLKYFPVCLAVEIILVLLVINKKTAGRRFPFIPFMSAGLLFSFVLTYNRF